MLIRVLLLGFFFPLTIQEESIETTTRKIVDVNSQEDLWNTIKDQYVQNEVEISPEGEVNKPLRRTGYLKVVCVSDTHDNFDKIYDSIPEGDVFVYAGDLSNYGEVDEINEYNRLVGQLPHKHKLVTSGNHELGFDKTEDESLRKEKYQGKGTAEGYKLLTNVTYLFNEGVKIDGVSFYGAPWHPLSGFPFYRTRDVIGQEWDKIPNDVDVLITHSPPLGYLDLYPPVERWGDYSLLQKINQVHPSFHVFGHNHYARGALSDGNTTFMNVASKRGDGTGYNPPLVFYIPKRRL